MTDLLTRLLTRLDEPLASFTTLDSHYGGSSPLSYLSPAAREALGNRLARVSVNLPRLLVDSVAERLRIVGFSGSADDAGLWADWLRCDLDQTSHAAHREALALGRAFVVVWAGRDGSPQVTIESPRQVAVLRDPATRQVLAAVKRWETDKSTEVTLFEAGTITRLSSPQVGATTTGFSVVERLRNPLGQPPVVPLVNAGRLLDDGTSEMADVIPISDAITKLTTDMLVASEYTARPRRWATGIELTEETDAETGETIETNPIPEGSRAMVSESPDSKFGQLPGSDLAGYEAGLNVLMRQVSAVTGLPEHMLGIGGDNPTSADSIRASEAALTARAEAKQATFGKAWEQVARLIRAVRTGVDPEAVQVRVQWADPSTRSVSQEADAVTKLFTAGLLPASAALSRLGYTRDQIAEIRADRMVDGFDPARSLGVTQ